MCTCVRHIHIHMSTHLFITCIHPSMRYACFITCIHPSITCPSVCHMYICTVSIHPSIHPSLASIHLSIHNIHPSVHHTHPSHQLSMRPSITSIHKMQFIWSSIALSLLCCHNLVAKLNNISLATNTKFEVSSLAEIPGLGHLLIFHPCVSEKGS